MNTISGSSTRGFIVDGVPFDTLTYAQAILFYFLFYTIYEVFPDSFIMLFDSSWRIKSVHFTQNDATQWHLPDETGSSA